MESSEATEAGIAVVGRISKWDGAWQARERQHSGRRRMRAVE